MCLLFNVRFSRMYASQTAPFGVGKLKRSFKFARKSTIFFSNQQIFTQKKIIQLQFLFMQ